MDLHDIEIQILQALSIILAGGLLWLMRQGASWIGLKLTADRQAMVSTVLDKMMTFGVTEVDALIRQKGWDHVDVANSVIQTGIEAAAVKFPDTLKAAGLDVTNPTTRAALVDQMQRMWPDVASRLAASPTTPPVEPPKQQPALVADPKAATTV